MAAISLPDYLFNVFDRLGTQYDTMASSFGQPQLMKGFPVFRYSEKTDALLCFLKGIKLVSTLNAALLLLKSGYAQETNALMRIADDCCSDIFFMLVPRNGSSRNKDQQRFFDEFFQEECVDPHNVLESQQKRDRVGRRQVHAAFADAAKEFANPSDTQAVGMAIHGAFSGYIHGAYPHIMELYGGVPGKFHLKGMGGTPRQAESAGSLVDQAHRGIIASEFVARKVGNGTCAASIHCLLDEYEKTLDCAPSGSPADLIRKAKKKPQVT